MTKIFSEVAINYETGKLGAYVDDYKTAYEWAKNWKAPKEENE